MNKLIVIEGMDSSGKETQTKLIAERLQREGYKIKLISFPDYESPACEPVKMYLKGDIGSQAEFLNPFAISTCYAIDRYFSFQMKWKKFYEDNYIIIADRYVSSNMIYQAEKIKNLEEKDAFLAWLNDLEYNKYKLPVPTETFYLEMPVKKSIKLMKNRKNKITKGSKKDIHEANEEFLINSYNNAIYVCEKYKWEMIKCFKENKLRTIEDINEELYLKIKERINN